MKQIILVASLCACLPLAALSQTTPPPDDGYPLREVRELTFAPLPGGGLLPYRQGKWWGYADTTGRVVITPGLVLGTLFPAAGLLRAGQFLAETEDEARKKRQLYQSYPPELYAYHRTQPQPRAFLNATGEVLRVAADEAAVLLPGGRLRAVRRSEVRAGQTELLDVAPLGQVEGFGYSPAPATPFITRRLAAPRVEQQRVAEELETAPAFSLLKHDVARLGTDKNLKIKPLGAGCYAVGTQTRVFERQAHGDSHHSGWRRGWGLETGLLALVNQRGSILTPFEYDYIDNFTTNRRWVVASRPDKARQYKAGHTGMLGRRGQEVLPFVHNIINPLPGGGALTWDWPDGNSNQWPRRYGLLDARGHWLLRPQTSLTLPDDAGYLRHHRTLAPGDTVVEFLTERGQPAFRTQPVLRQATGFERGRAWVRTDRGPGLLNARGRWVVPPGRYEQILSMDETDSYGLRYQGQAWDRPAALDLVMASAFDALFERCAPPTFTPPDTTYLLVRQGGRFGLIRRATGAVVVPCRYEEITCWSGQYGTGRRDGQDYVLAARTGSELLPGQYRGEWYRFPGGPRLLQVYRDRQPSRWYGHWLVADTSGRALTPEFTRVGYDNYLTPDDWATLMAPPGPRAAAATADSTSFPLLPRPANIGYSGLLPWFHSGRGATSIPLTPSGAYRRTLPGGGERLLVYRAGRLRDLTGHTYYALELLAGGWHHGRTAERQDLLISPTGQEYAPPPDLRWNTFYHAIGRVVPFANGTAAAAYGPSSQPLLGGEDQEGGLVTRGGTLLWDTDQWRH
ncbi:MAG: WG repeat-containing protein [Janthinobacterium lividum]